jgi:CRP-like cAMP-binding protein
MDALTQLQSLVQQTAPVSTEDWEAFAAIWKPVRARRKELLTAAGDKEPYLYFVYKGLQRVYYLDDQDREATLVFTYAPSFGGVLDAMMLKQPSRYYYETLTASEFLRADYAAVEQLMNERNAINLMVRTGLVTAMSGLLERLAEIQCFSSSEKFTRLLQRSPHILQLIPHKYIASYLGIDASNFSKMINRIRI